MNKIINFFQTIHTFISDPVMIFHHIIVILQLQDQILQNGTVFLIVILNVLK